MDGLMDKGRTRKGIDKEGRALTWAGRALTKAGRANISSDNFDIITPNRLILGRNSTRGLPMEGPLMPPEEIQFIREKIEIR